jgi:hypothetical protein
MKLATKLQQHNIRKGRCTHHTPDTLTVFLVYSSAVPRLRPTPVTSYFLMIEIK